MLSDSCPHFKVSRDRSAPRSDNSPVVLPLKNLWQSISMSSCCCCADAASLTSGSYLVGWLSAIAVINFK